jgi:hypothetical protein
LKQNQDVASYAQAFMFMVERFKNPYKPNEFRDEEENSNTFCPQGVFNDEGKIDIWKVDERRILAPKSKLMYNIKVKLFSKEYDQLDAEKTFVSYIENNILNVTNLYFAVYAFEGIINNFFKRRESSNKKYTGLTKEISDNNVKPVKESDDHIMEKQEEEDKPVTEEEKDIVVVPAENENAVMPNNNTIVEASPFQEKVKVVKKSSLTKGIAKPLVTKDTRKTRPKKITVNIL